MKDITESLKQAINTNTLWGLNGFYSFLNLAKDLNIKISYWDGEENWATISSIDGDHEIGYLWRKYPLIFLKNDIGDNIKDVVSQFHYIVVIHVSSLTSKELVIRPEKDLIDRLGFINYGVQISASDIWFNTVN